MKRLLIANRGEVALRILRACRASGVETVAAFSQVDRKLPHIPLADDAVCVSRQSYLGKDTMISAALSRHCDAVHPGYGFLSEDANFAAEVEANGLTFVGPSAEHIALMGDKAKARLAMEQASVPVLPGSGVLVSIDEALKEAGRVGYPVILKASFGGGGRGMNVVASDDELRSAYKVISAEAESLFDKADIYLEKYLDAARHIELQVAGDGRGEVIFLGARECSIQRRHQKVLEEAPPGHIDEGALTELARQCVSALSKITYRNLGTIEFLFQDGEFFFIEMNTRLQVEHPVTECVTGVDLVRLQLYIAEHRALGIRQEDISEKGHALECRINAETTGFDPSPGNVTRLRVPGGVGVRFDTFLYEGLEVSHYYDSLVGKLITHGRTRDDAIALMITALDELDTGLLENNAALHQTILADSKFRSGEYHTGFLSHALV